jgi:autotransporter-associated beta strand protein
MIRFQLALAAALAAAGFPGGTARAQTWTGAVSGSWNISGNWSPAGVPASGINTSLTFGSATTAAMTNDVAGTFLLNQMTFAAGGPTYTLTGNALGFSNSGLGASPQVNFNTAANVSIADNVALNGGLSVVGTGTGTLTLNGLLNGSGGLTLSGAGTVALGNGSNTYAGNTVVSSGTLLLTSGTAIPAGGNVLVGGGTFSTGGLFNTPATAIGRLTVNGSGTFRVPSGSNDYYLNQLQTTGGTVDLTGTTNYWLHFTGAGAAIATNSATTTTSWVGAGTSRIQNDTANPLTITVNPSFLPSGIDLDDGIILSAGNGGNPNFTITGPGTMRLTNVGNTANLTVNNGRLRVDDISSNGGVGALGTGTLTLSGSSTTLLYGGPTATTNKPITISGSPQILVFPNNVNLTLSSAINESPPGSGSGIIFNGPGVVGASSTVTTTVLNNSYSGPTSVRGNAVLAVPTIANGGAASPIGSSSNASANVILGDSSVTPNTSGTLLLTGTNTSYSTDRGATIAGVYASSGGGAIGVQNAATTLTMSGLITGSGSFIKTGAGTLLLTSGNNSYTGGTFVEAGTFRLISGGSLPAGGAVNLLAGTLDLNGFSTSIGSLAGAAGTFVLTGGGTLTAGTDNTNTTFAGNLLGGTLAKTGTGILTLTGTGTTTSIMATNGVVSVPDMADLGTGTVTISNFAGLYYSGPTQTSAKPLTVSGSADLAVNTGGTNLTLSGVISELGGSSTIQFAGPAHDGFSGTATVTLTANNSYTGTTFINGRAVVAVPTITNGGVASPIGASSSASSNLALGYHSLNPGVGRGDLLLTGTNSTYSTDRGVFLAGLYSFFGTIGNGGAIGVQNPGTTLTWSGQLTSISFDGSFIKTGAGTLVLTNTTNNYAGDTYVEGGTLSIGVAGPVIPVNSNATVFSGGTFQVGFTSGDNSAAPLGTLTLDGGTFRIPAGNPVYAIYRLTTTAAGGTVDLTASTGTLRLEGTGPGATINGNSTWTGDSAFAIVDNFTGGQADLTIVPNVTLTSHIPVVNSYQILGGGTLYMVGPGNGFHNSYAIRQGRLRVDDLSVAADGSSLLGTTAFGLVPVTLDGGILQFSGPTQTSTMPIDLSAAGGTIEVSNAATTLTLTGSITGSGLGPLAKTGPGVLVLANTQNLYAGGIVVNAGRLDVSDDAQLGLAAVTVNPFGTLRYTASTTSSRTFTLNSGALEVPSGVTLTLNGAAVGGGFIRGAGTFNVSGGSALTGVTTAAGATVGVSGPAAFTDFTNGSPLTIAAGLAIPITFSLFTNQGSGAITAGANSQVNVADFQTYGTLTLSPGSAAVPTQVMNTGGSPLFFNGGSRTFISVPSHAGQFDAGIDLHGNNAVVAGGLLVNNGYVVDSMGSHVIIADFGALVKGAGFYQNTVQTVNGGKFQSGNSPGSSSFGSFAFGPGGVSNYVFAIDDATGTAGPSPDANGLVSGWGLVKAVQRPAGAVTTPGDFLWTADAAHPLTVHLDTLVNPTTVGTDVTGTMADFDPTKPYSWLAASWDGTYAGPADPADLIASTVFDTSGFANPIAGTFGWTFGSDGHNLSLTYTPSAVPEPGTLILTALAGLGTAIRRRSCSRGDLPRSLLKGP